jgi:Cation/multidrug efflux pump
VSQSSPLGLAGRFAAAFIDSKLTPLIVVAAVLFGAIAIALTPRTYNPDIIVPVINVTVQRPGSDARQMLTQWSARWRRWSPRCLGSTTPTAWPATMSPP